MDSTGSVASGAYVPTSAPKEAPQIQNPIPPPPQQDPPCLGRGWLVSPRWRSMPVVAKNNYR